MQIDRHQIVHLDPAAWPAVLAAQPSIGSVPAIVEWPSLGRPLIARRALCNDGAGLIPLGLPLPPSMGKRRLAFAVSAETVRSAKPPPLLEDARRIAPVAWYPYLTALIAIDPRVRCFGSLAWEYLTGLPYLSATSDIDLLWSVSTMDDADALVAAIAPVDAAAPMHIDGEIVSPGGLAIQWREWAGEASDLLAKTWDGNRLIARQAVFA